jgi:3-dehydroquinate dehydratase
MRIEITKADYDLLLHILIVNKRNIQLGQRLKNAIISDKLQQLQEEKREASKQRIIEAVQSLQANGERVTISAVQRVSGISRVTIGKYKGGLIEQSELFPIL